MTGRSSRFTTSNRRHSSSRQHLRELCHRTVVHFDVYPGQTLSWCVEQDSEVSVCAPRVQLTGHPSICTRWLQAGEVLRLSRGERVWICNDANRKAQIALSTEPAAHQTGRCARLSSLLGELGRGLSLLRARR
ncbi:DUF2917 domain-containing protein [Paraburkholderia kururiensis]|uniref:DUF2917 domain-containing protein n=1 Tax=Paraburkholderia kururiensis TaxID=984307 RepID=UPI0039A69B57